METMSLGSECILQQIVGTAPLISDLPWRQQVLDIGRYHLSSLISSWDPSEKFWNHSQLEWQEIRHNFGGWISKREEESDTPILGFGIHNFRWEIPLLILIPLFPPNTEGRDSLCLSYFYIIMVKTVYKRRYLIGLQFQKFRLYDSRGKA